MRPRGYDWRAPWDDTDTVYVPTDGPGREAARPLPLLSAAEVEDVATREEAP